MGETKHHLLCESCGKNALSRYPDGGTYCFRCKQWTKGNQSSMPIDPSLITYSTASGLPARGIDRSTCEKWDYGYGRFNGLDCHVATYFDIAGRPVAQKLRFEDKSFRWVGNHQAIGLYGDWLWRGGGRRVVVTDGS